MRAILKYLVNGFGYLILQGIIEIILIVILEYLGIKVLTYFSETNLFIENLQGVAWVIGMKTAMFCFLYLPLFVGASALLKWKNVTGSLRDSVINMLLNILLFMIYFFLRDTDFKEVSTLFIVTLLSSGIIIAAVKIIKNKKTQA